MKKILSIFLALTILMTTFMSTTAFAVAETESARETKIYFEAPEEWGTIKNVYCLIDNVYGGKELPFLKLNTDSTKCELVDAESRLYSFDTSVYCLENDNSGYAIEDNADYFVVFSAKNTEGKTFNTLKGTLGSPCMGDTVKVDCVEVDLGDSVGHRYFLEWVNNSDKYGYMATITPTGEVAGKYFPVYQPTEEIISNWLGTNGSNKYIITAENVQNICVVADVEPQSVYDTYAQMYAEELADIENNPDIAPLERVGVLLGLENPVYVVAGSEEICLQEWNGDPTQVPYNVMTKIGDVYKLTFYYVEPNDVLEIKVVEWDYDLYPDWYGCAGGGSVRFKVLSQCHVTVTYNPTNHFVDVSGDGVEILPDFEINTISVAGNGTGNWLNGAEWKPEDDSNVMTELEENLYQITYEDVEAGEDYQFKFVADGSWADNWGGVFESFGTETNAVYNGGDNILFSLTEKSDVTITLDLREFNFATKEGGKFTVTATPVEHEYLLVIDLGGPLLLPPPTYPMEKNNGVYQYTFFDCEPIVAGMAQIFEKDGNQFSEYYGNIEFDITEKSDITVIYNPATGEISVSGEHVKIHTIPIENAEVYLYGNGDGNWLNGSGWIFLDDSNIMTEIESGLYQIEYKNLDKNNGYEFKFKVGEDTSDDFTGVYNGENIESDAVLYKYQNITFSVPLDNSDVTITFDLRNFDNTTKQGAKFIIDIKSLGDVSDDGIINIIDATEIMKYSAELIDETQINLKYADVNGDGIVNVIDATAIQKSLAGI